MFAFWTITLVVCTVRGFIDDSGYKQPTNTDKFQVRHNMLKVKFAERFIKPYIHNHYGFLSSALNLFSLISSLVRTRESSLPAVEATFGISITSEKEGNK